MFIILGLLAIFILPVLLVYFKIIPYRFRVWILGLISLAVVFIAKWRGRNLQQIGLRIDNLQESFLPYLLFTFVGLLLLFIFVKSAGRQPNPDWKKSKHFLGLFIPVSFLQEFVYRGFLVPELYSLTNNFYLIILLNAFLFALIHIIYKTKATDLLLIFIGGIVLASMYIYYPNLILIGVSHSILNFFIVLYGLYSEERK